MKIYIVLMDPRDKPAVIHAVRTDRDDAESEADIALCQDAGTARIYEYNLDFGSIDISMTGCNKVG